ncbi:MAG: BrnT family toxin [Chloroflexota bacterium]
MEITEFEWDEGNLEEIYRHRVRPEEVEQCFFNRPQWHKRKPHRSGAQERFYLLGQTDGGRTLFIVYQRKKGGVIRPITAYDK